ncbi:hypothetical protein [Bradyrhizobium sp. GM2.2]|uniref:hypothetical protein n=1 Tax=Bradyrhizobium sp. GM2.2 TaxID=3156358 RepID=UPI00339AC7FB
MLEIRVTVIFALALEELEADATEDELAAERALAKTTTEFTRVETVGACFCILRHAAHHLFPPPTPTNDWRAYCARQASQRSCT